MMKQKLNDTIHNHFSGKRRLALLLTVLLLAAALVTVCLAAIVGRGTRKGVLTGTVGYFSSDLLPKWTDGGNISSVEIPGEVNFSLRNYDVSTGDTNNFDVVYKIYAWVEDSNLDAGMGFTYYLEDGSTHYQITQTSDTTDGANTQLLMKTFEANAQQTHSYTVSFRSSNPNALSQARIVVAAIPSSPEFMISKRRIGGFKDMPDAYLPSGEFEYSAGTTVNDYAGFIFRLTGSGTPEEGDEVKIQWNATNLTLDENSDYNTTPYLQTDGSETYLIVPASEIETGVTLTFFRNIDDASSYWADTPPSWTALRALVIVSKVTTG